MRFAGYVLCWGLAMTCAAVASAPQQPPVEAGQQAVIELERAWNEVFYAKDIAFIEGVLADEFTATYDDGSRGDRARELALSTEFNQQVESAVQEDLTVKIYGETAVVWFTLRLVGIRQGERARRQLALCVDPEHSRRRGRVSLSGYLLWVEETRRQVVVQQRSFVIRRPQHLFSTLKQCSQASPVEGRDRDPPMA